MAEWIFQANPDAFDIDAFLSTDPATMLCLANQHRSDLQLGDTVFLWRSIGSGQANLSGVIAEATVINHPVLQPEDPAALQFWTNPGAASLGHRVRLRLERIELKDLVKREWLKNDPVCRYLRIFKFASETNYLLSSEHGRRLMNIWRRANAPWDYADTIAGLWAFAKTRGGTVSILPGSPVAVAALRTGRVVREGMANKVQNFISLDPTDPRRGFPHVNAFDRAVWAEFFDNATSSLDLVGIQREFNRLWPDDHLPDAAAPLGPRERANDLQKLQLEELLKRWASKDAQLGVGAKPKVVRSTTSGFQREPLVVAIALKRANGRCEVPQCQHVLFPSADGQPFLEVHHIEPMGEGGLDTPENAAAVCPSHHREAHHGSAAPAIKQALKRVRANDSMSSAPA